MHAVGLYKERDVLILNPLFHYARVSECNALLLVISGLLELQHCPGKGLVS